MNEKTNDLDQRAGQGPQSALERKFIENYLKERGTSLAALSQLPPERAKALLKAACMHAALELAQIQARARFVEEIKPPSP